MYVSVVLYIEGKIVKSRDQIGYADFPYRNIVPLDPI